MSAPTFGIPTDATDPAATMERLMRGASRLDVLCLLARYITKRPDLATWFLLEQGRVATTRAVCLVCGAVINEGQKTFAEKTKRAVNKHGEKHVDELLQGKYKETP